MCAVCARAVFFSPLYSVFGARSENGTSRLGYGTERAEEMCRCERKQLLQITVRIETNKKSGRKLNAAAKVATRIRAINSNAI